MYIYVYIYVERKRQRERNVYSFFSFADSLMYTELVTLLNATNLKMGPQSHTPFVDIQQILIAGCRICVDGKWSNQIMHSYKTSRLKTN